jgi:hypothetical protein
VTIDQVVLQEQLGVVAIVLEEAITPELLSDIRNIQSRLTQIKNINLELLIELTQQALEAAEYLNQAVELADIFDFMDVQENDLITYTSGRWVNKPADDILDAGNF